MILFIPVASQAISAVLLALTRSPGAEADGQDVFPTIVAKNESKWMQVETDYDILVHPAAELGPIATILQPWIKSGQLPPDTNTQLSALIESKRGQRLVVYDAFPQLFKSMSKTYAEMIDAGLLAQPTMP